MLLTLLLALIMTPSPFQQKQDVGELRVYVKNIVKTQGQIIAALFDTGTGFPNDLDSARRIKFVPVDEMTTVQFSFEAVPYGIYAIVIIHDLNGNGFRDEGFFGGSTEPILYSSPDPQKPGSADFNEASFEVKSPQVVQRIVM